jgi:recombinational DNA repair protein RecT
MENTKIAADAARWIDLGYDRKAVELGKMIHEIGEDVFLKAYNVALERNPQLTRCTAESLVTALLLMLHLGLGLDHVVLEPVFNLNLEHEYVCKFRLTCKGYLELSRRCGGESEKSA